MEGNKLVLTKIWVLILASLVFQPVLAQNKILIDGATVHTGDGTVIAQGLVGIVDGKITLIKNALSFNYKPSDWDTIIKAHGHHLYPGFIAPNSTLGLSEVDAVRATLDFKEVGKFNPHIRALIAFNVESRIIPTTITNGVLIAQTTPRGGMISGSSSIMRLSGWNWEDAVILSDDGIRVNWPKTIQGGGWWAEPAPKKTNEKYEEQYRELIDFLSAAKAYADTPEKSRKFDARYAAMVNIFNGKQRCYFHADELKALQDVIQVAQKLKIQKPVIVGGYDSYLITEILKDAEIPVMLTRLHSLPSNEDDPIDLVYRLPKLLHDGGVLFCLQNAGSMETMHTRNLPFLAGTARAYGLLATEAIKAISLNAAEIIGISDKYGSISLGKSATLFLSKGDALEVKSNQVELILIDGKFIPVTNHQYMLYERYYEKYKKSN